MTFSAKVFFLQDFFKHGVCVLSCVACGSDVCCRWKRGGCGWNRMCGFSDMCR